MEEIAAGQELHHDIFGSVLDKSEMTPYLLLKTDNYEKAIRQAAKMMGNRGFDLSGSSELPESEKIRAQNYVGQVSRYCLNSMLPFMKGHLQMLLKLKSGNCGLYRKCLQAIGDIESVMQNVQFREIINDDPRHLFLMASAKKYPHVFSGYRDRDLQVPADWQQTACSILKLAHLIKSIEEDSQDVNDYAQLGLFLEMQGQNLDDLYHYNWHIPKHLPASEAAKRAFVKISTFFHKLQESIRFNEDRNYIVFNSGDGVEVDILEIKSRLKSPESMFTKLGKDVEGEAQDIRDILAITFILKSKDDTLKLFHALQKRGVILQENTLSSSITQTLFDDPESMKEAVRILMISLSRSEGRHEMPEEDEVLSHARNFYRALSVNTAKNPHSSQGHKKFQCKINFCVPIHRKAGTNEIIVPGTSAYTRRHQTVKNTEQHTLALELRISDQESWHTSEHHGDSHHAAYKFRQLTAVMNRVFRGAFYLPEESIAQLRKDQKKLFP